MRRILWVAAAPTVSLFACGDGESPGGPPPGSTEATGTDGGNGGGGNRKICTAGKLCLQVAPVVPGSALPARRRVVAWQSIDASKSTPPLITHDVPFDADDADRHRAHGPPARARRADALPPELHEPGVVHLRGGSRARIRAGRRRAGSEKHDGKLSRAELEATLFGAALVDVVYGAKAFDPLFDNAASVLPEGINAGTSGAPCGLGRRQRRHWPASCR